MSLRVFVDGEPVRSDFVRDAVISASIEEIEGTFDLDPSITINPGDTVTIADGHSKVIATGTVTSMIRSSSSVSGTFRDTSVISRAFATGGWFSGVAHGTGFYLAPEPDDIEISAEDYAIIDEFIIDSVAAGHARRL